MGKKRVVAAGKYEKLPKWRPRVSEWHHWKRVHQCKSYWVSRCGTVRNQFGMDMRINRTGEYPAINLCRDGVQKTHRIHNLVLTAFGGARPAGHQCNHKNGDKFDNRIENLEWMTPSENSQHAYDTGLSRPRGIALRPDHTERSDV